ncbi:MAG: acyltransferase family protein, partial [Actinobacteria bacterium]|nr:acyltransferase family protein [Actinomycetota bacterium]
QTFIPVLSTMLLLWVGGSDVALENRGPKLFELDFVQKLGTWSYSIYLWHWPLLFLAVRAFQPSAKSPEELKLTIAVPVVILSVVLAAATYRWVENPLRNAPSLKVSARKSLALGLGLSILVAGAATVAYANPNNRTSSKPINDLSNLKSAKISNPDWVSTLIADTAPKLTSTDGIVLTPGEIKSARSDFPRTYSNGCHTSSPDPALPKGCVFGSSQSGRLIGLFGNSHANQYFEGVLAAAKENDAKALSLTRSGCSVADVDFVLGAKAWDVCNKWRKNAVTAIIKAQPAVLFVASTLKTSIIDPKTGSVAATSARGKELYLAGFKSMVANFTKAGIKVVVIRDNPFFDANALDCLSARTATACTQPIVPFLTPAQFSSGAVSGIKNAVGVDLTETYCTNKVCPAVRDGHVVWRDEHHLTSTYATLLSPIFSGIIKHELSLNKQ